MYFCRLMYIPKEFQITDIDEAVAFMKRYSFGTIVSNMDGVPVATHLPFHVAKHAEQIVLSAHFAKANSQWETIQENDVLVIFSQPHAYISPQHYDKEQNVPTWNYVAVHAYGSCKLIIDNEKGMKILEDMIMQHEPGYINQWERLDNRYKDGLYKGIVPFEINVKSIQSAGKLSQNKSESEKKRIIEALSGSNDSVERELAEYMSGKSGR